MHIALTFWDVSLWLAYTALILLATSEFLSYYGLVSISIKTMKAAASFFGILFIVTVLFRIFEIITII